MANYEKSLTGIAKSAAMFLKQLPLFSIRADAKSLTLLPENYLVHGRTTIKYDWLIRRIWLALILHGI